MRPAFYPGAWANYLDWQKIDRKRLNQVIEDARRSPYAGIGHPEPLKGNLKSYWSRRIDGEHCYETWWTVWRTMLLGPIRNETARKDNQHTTHLARYRVRDLCVAAPLGCVSPVFVIFGSDEVRGEGVPVELDAVAGTVGGDGPAVAKAERLGEEPFQSESVELQP